MKVANPFSESGEMFDFYSIMDIKHGLTEESYKRLAILYKYKVEKNQFKKEKMKEIIVSKIGQELFIVLDKYLKLNDEKSEKLPALIWFEETSHHLDFIEGLGRLSL